MNSAQPLTQLLTIHAEVVSLPALGMEFQNLQCSLEVTLDPSLYAEYLRLLARGSLGDLASQQGTHKLLT